MRVIPVLAACLVLVGCSGGDDPAPKPTIDGVQVFSGLSHDHLGKGKYPQDYEQSPPVGGPHSPIWIKCQVYDVELPKEAAVHSEEHGGVWLTYQPELPAGDVATLTSLAQTNVEFVLVSPYAGQDSPVVASTWGLQLRVDRADDPRLLEFIRTYAGGDQGGEKGVGCAKTGGTLEQVKEYLASQS